VEESSLLVISSVSKFLVGTTLWESRKVDKNSFCYIGQKIYCKKSTVAKLTENKKIFSNDLKIDSPA